MRVVIIEGHVVVSGCRRLVAVIVVVMVQWLFWLCSGGDRWGECLGYLRC